MADFKVNQITSTQDEQGTVFAGVTTVSSTGAMRIPSGVTGSAYGSGNLDVVKDESLVIHLDAKHSYDERQPGIWYDLSGNGHDAILYGTTLPTYNSSNGGSVVFSESNGNYGLASINHHQLEGAYNGPFTMEIWAYPTNNADYGWVLGTGPDDYSGIGYHAGSSPATNYMYGRNGGGGNLINYVTGGSINAWSHVVMRLNNTGHGEVQTGTKEYVTNNVSPKSNNNFKNYQSLPGEIGTASTKHFADVFVNGAYQITGDIGAYVITDPTEYISLGVYGYVNNTSGQITSGEKFTGRMGVVRVYNRALSDAEILRNYNADKTRFGL